MDSNEGPSSVGSTVINSILWMILPSAITNFLLNQYYKFKYSKNSPKIPKPNSSKHKKNYKICYTLVIGLYFSYCLGQAFYSLEESYYSKMGLRRGCSRAEFKKNSRKLLLMYHPDKSPGNSKQYQELKKMAETLENPNLCNVYEKFGDSGIKLVSQYASKKNYVNDQEIRRDYIFATLFEWVSFYIGSVAVIFLLSFTQKSGSGKYWKFISLICLASYETYMYFNNFSTMDSIHAASMFSWTRPWSLINYFLTQLPLYQKIKILRQLFVYSGLAMSQLGPLWFPERPELFSDKKALLQELQNLQNGVISELFDESKYVFNSAFEIFESNEEMKKLLKRQMGQVVVDLKYMEAMAQEDLIGIKKSD